MVQAVVQQQKRNSQLPKIVPGTANLRLHVYLLKRRSAGEVEWTVKPYSPGKEQKSKLVKCLAE